MEYPWSNKGKGGKDELSSFGEHGQTVGDINKSHKADPPKSGTVYTMRPKKDPADLFFFKKKYVQAPYGAEAPN